MRSNLKVKLIVPQLVKPGGEYTESVEEVAAVLSDFFKSVFTEEGDGPLAEYKRKGIRRWKSKRHRYNRERYLQEGDETEGG